MNSYDWNATSPTTPTNALQKVLEAYRRATFRPLPFNSGGFISNPSFTGGNTDYAITTPMPYKAISAMPGSRVADLVRLQLVTQALVNGPWDVDNDGDGVADSIWVDLGLPLITSPEGKLLRPLIATMIEDTSNKLNVNTHGFYPQTDRALYWNNRVGAYAGTYQNSGQFLFRGVGFGPAEITFPVNNPFTGISGADLTGSVIHSNELLGLIRERYRWGDRPEPAFPVPGDSTSDSVDRLLTTRPGTCDSMERGLYLNSGSVVGNGNGQSLDPFGYGGMAIDRYGHTIATNAGQVVQPLNTSVNPIQPRIDEAINDPYEFDPAGRFNGDSAYALAELEGILRSNNWDVDTIPQRLRTLLQQSLRDNPSLGHQLTALSSSTDIPSAIPLASGRGGSSLDQNGFRREKPGVPRDLASVIAQRLNIGLTFPGANVVLANTRYKQLIAPELRLGRKIDLNRAIGNGIDDNANGVIDEPAEFGNFIDDPGSNQNGWVDEISEFRALISRGHNGIDDDGDSVVDEADERPLGINYSAFPFASTLDRTSNLFGQAPAEYAFGSTENDVSGSGRELLARHLYVLMMALKAQGYNLPLLQNAGNATEVNNQADYDAYRLAQWAVNVVDFRDPDSIMTRFVYDPNPLNGWDLFQADGATLLPTSRVVWGCENPELTFSEATAFHDVRVKDTTLEQLNEGGKMKGDPNNPDPLTDETDGIPDTDQIRIPQGSLFLELYCNRQSPIYPASATSAQESAARTALQGVPRELYNVVDTDTDGDVDTAFLDLARTAPIANGQQVGAPVWRIAISSPHYPNSPLADVNPDTLRQSHPNSYSFQPEQPFLVPPQSAPPANNLTYDRFVVFQNYQNVTELNNAGLAMSDPVGTVIPGSRLFFVPNLANNLQAFVPNPNLANNLQAAVRTGEYVVLAPREVTHLGSERYSDADGDPSGPDTDPTSLALPVKPSAQRLEIETDNNGDITGRGIVSHDLTDADVSPNPTTVVAPSRTLMVKTFTPGWAAGAFDNDMVGLNVSEPLPLGGNYYREPTSRLASMNADFPLRDAYVDYDDTANTAAHDQPEDIRLVNSPVAQLTAVRRGGGASEPFLGTQQEFCSAFLQRLADPTRPFDPTFNPYITVDWTTIDLTVFSGEESPRALDRAGFANDNYATRTRERDGQDANGTASNALFTYSTQDTNVTAAIVPANAPNYFQFVAPAANANFTSTLGYLNVNSYGTTLGLAASSAAIPVTMGLDRGQPQTPFSTHDWLNRPFASHYELMLVPASSASRFFDEFTVSGAATAYFAPSGTTFDDNLVDDYHGHHRHLLNLFQGSITETDTAQFPRIFDYVTTMPRFRGEVELVNPSRLTFAPNTTWPRLDVARGALVDLQQAPFSVTYDNGRQGQINLNTVSQFPVWQGLMQGLMTNTEFGQNELTANTGTPTQAAFGKFTASRRGYNPSPQRSLVVGNAPNSNGPAPYSFGTDYLNGDFPTQFARPLRDVVDADIAPVFRDHSNGNNNLRRSGVHGSLLRPDSDLNSADQTNPFFIRPGVGATHESRDRNAFMKYQTLMRMPNLVSKQSNVFVMRMTMGFFEVDAATLSLGREYKEDIAQNKRHQMLYIIDRSKPVAFIPGENTNVRDTIIYERAVE
ncbi:MAG: hypothetical protein WBD31_26850 [Rubripirellula sp.]